MVRINQYVAQATGLSRRSVDKAILAGRVLVNGQTAQLGQSVDTNDHVTLDGQPVTPAAKIILLLNKPAGYVCSRQGQGSRTIYDLLPAKYHQLKPIGRLDKDSSGLLLMTNDGELAQRLAHPSAGKSKIYQIILDRELDSDSRAKIEQGVKLDDGHSHLKLSGRGKSWTVTMSEGRNRQIRRTFASVGYDVIRLHRTDFGSYKIGDLKPGQFVEK